MPSRFPIAYWPSISYLTQVMLLKDVCLELDETYQKQSIRNRCSILTANGVQDLSIPVRKPQGSKTITRNIEIDFSQDWQTVHWRTIRTAYASSPYFEHYGPEVEALIFQRETNLNRFNQHIFERILNWFELKPTLSFSDNFHSDYQADFLNSFSERDSKPGYFYQQVFTNRTNFEADLSVLDLVFNLGPMGRKLILP